MEAPEIERFQALFLFTVSLPSQCSPLSDPIPRPSQWYDPCADSAHAGEIILPTAYALRAAVGA